MTRYRPTEGHGFVTRWVIPLVVPILALVAILAGTVAAQDATSFARLQPGQQVYDETGTSLSAVDVALLERHIDRLEANGTHVVLYVRNLMATPDETLAQVEALQQAWVRTAGVDQDTAVAILINRNPDDPNDARAGIFVGRTYNEGNVPEGEQRAIVEHELIPPLRDGDVFASFSGALDRLESSIVNGPPQSAFEKWSQGAADTWLPWAAVAAASVAIVPALLGNRQIQRLSRASLPPATARPGNLPPSLAGGLVAGGPQSSAIPATILDLASRGALAIEPESAGGIVHKPKIKVRLLDRQRASGDVETIVWDDLARRADGDVVSSKELGRMSTDWNDVKNILKDRMRGEGWLAEGYGLRSTILWSAAVVAVLLAIFLVIVAVTASSWYPVIGIVALAIPILGLLVVIGRDSPLTLAGQEAALPWKAYKEGIKRAAGDMTIQLDLNQALPDAVAMNLGSKLDNRLEHAVQAGIALNAFSASTAPGAFGSSASGIVYWTAFNSTMVSSSGSATSGTVSGGGAGGGGGAAGST